MPDSSPGSALENGIHVVVKRDCSTCVMVAPLLTQLQSSHGITIYSQDDASFPGGAKVIHDADLSFSWHNNIETVPTVIKVVDGAETERTVGWLQKEWAHTFDLPNIGDGLPAYRPGCGSLSVDPDKVDALRAKFEGSLLVSRRVEIASLEDEMEALFARGWTDGLPVVPPTQERVMRMLSGTSLAPSDIVAIAPPDLVELTVEKIAINAVMAGCLPEYLPWVIAALKAVCTDDFNMHGVLATTMPVGPVIVCSGPGSRAIGMNSGVNVLGQGNRANMTIGRAVQLTIRNVGGGRPGEIDRAAHGMPGKLSFCFAEDEVGSPWTSLAVARGVAPDTDAVTVFAGEGPRCVTDQLARYPEQLVTSLAATLLTVEHPKLPLAYDAMLVVGPEHARVFGDAGWSRERVIEELHARLQLKGTDIVRGSHGMAEGVLQKYEQLTVSKFRPNGILLVHAGGGAGLFSEIIGGWASGAVGSEPVTQLVTNVGSR